MVVYDDGNITSLQPALGAVTSVSGSLLLVGGVAMGAQQDAPGLANFDGLQRLTVSGVGVRMLV